MNPSRPNRSTDARESWEAIANTLAGSVENYEPKLLVILAAAQLRLGRSSAAQAIAKRLHDLAAPAGE